MRQPTELSKYVNQAIYLRSQSREETPSSRDGRENGGFWSARPRGSCEGCCYVMSYTTSGDTHDESPTNVVSLDGSFVVSAVTLI